MAINPNFAFMDAVPAQQTVQMAQIAALADAERRKAIASQQIARENAAEQRAYTQSQMLQQDKALAQNERNAARQAGLYEQDLKLRRDIDLNRGTSNVGDTRFNTIQSAIESTDPPTELELEGMFARFPELKPADMDLLRQTRLNRVNELSKSADIGDQFANLWNSALGRAKSQVERDEVLQNAQKQHGRFIILNPETGMFTSLFTRPRVDSRIEPETGMAPGSTPVDSMGATPIEDIRAGIRRPIMQSMIPPSPNGVPWWMGSHPLLRSIGINPVENIMSGIRGLGNTNQIPQTPFIPPTGTVPFTPPR